MTKLFSRFALRLFIFSVLLALVHWLLILFTELHLQRGHLFELHLFLAIITLLVFWALCWVWKRHFDKVGFAFLAFVLLKMAVAMLYLLPWLRSDQPYFQNAILHFMAAYFLYLFLETREVLTIMRIEPPKAPAEGNE